MEELKNDTMEELSKDTKDTMDELSKDTKDIKEELSKDAKVKNTQTESVSFVKELIIDVIIAAVLAGAILVFVRPTIVRQSSMENTFMEGDYLIMYERAYKNSTPQRGDVVVFESGLVNEENGKSKLLIKRVIGLPGDVISIQNQQLYINGEAYVEDYIKDGYTPAVEIPQEGEEYVVPEGEYFVMGDNRVVSMDSRYSEVGCITVDQIRGKVVLRLYPFSKIQKF